MLPDLRTRAKLRRFLCNWLKVDQAPDIAKDSAAVSGFDARSRFGPADVAWICSLDDVVWSEQSDFRELLLADSLLSQRPAGEALRRRAAGRLRRFRRWRSMTGNRAGVLTHPYLMAAFAYTAHQFADPSRRVHRPQPAGPHAAAAAGSGRAALADLHADLTTRERVLLQTKAEACQSCHGMINPLGFTLENFDAVGRFRAAGEGQADRRQRQLPDPHRRDGASSAARRNWRNSWPTARKSHSCLRRATVPLPDQAADPGLRPEHAAELRDSFAKNEFNIRELTAEIVTDGGDRSSSSRFEQLRS